MTTKITADNIQANTIVSSKFVSNVGVLIAGDNISINANGQISLALS
jgi:hypothetical protein